MPIVLQVSEVRSRIWQATGGARGDGEPSTPLLGRLFHEVFADLVGADARKNYLAALEEAEPDLESWKRDLKEHTYQALVGPRLRRNQALLQPMSEKVLLFWDAVQEMCDWLAGLLWQFRGHHSRLLPPGEIIATEREIECELRDESWREPVVLTGVADAIVRIPGKEQWCVIELKTGRTAPVADLAQACLYHLMIGMTGDGEAGSMALVSFEPRRCERLFSAKELSNAQIGLKQFIGQMAGVTSPPAGDPSPPAVVADSNGDSRVQPGRPLTFGAPTPEHVELGRKLLRAVKEFGADVSLAGDPVLSPTFVRYPIALGTGVRFPALQKAAADSQFRLQLEAPPVAGHEKGRVVIDLQRPDRQYVLFSQIREQLPKGDRLAGSSIAPLGVDIQGRLQTVDFAKSESAHLLAAGTPGSGKSEWLRAAVAGLLVCNTPETLKLLPIDPKRNAFQMLRGSRYLLTGEIVYPDECPIEEALDVLIVEMEKRYAMMGRINSDSLADYVRHTGRSLPRIFCVCDEYADLILRDRKQRARIEDRIIRLGNKARAAGIHLILATQQPSREVIKGALDSTISARVGLKMSKSIESRMLLNTDGAENLLGRGDLLYKCIGDPIRLQSVWLPPGEMEEIFGAPPANR